MKTVALVNNKGGGREDNVRRQPGRWHCRREAPGPAGRSGCRPGTATPRSGKGRQAFQPDRPALMQTKLGSS